jgi:hypothetical protein
MSGGGRLERRRSEARTQKETKMSQFVFLYRGGERQWQSSPQAMQQNMQKWTTWMKELGDKGHMKDPGQPLDRVGKIVKGTSKAAITDAPLAETKDLVGGYTLIEAKDLAQAAELSLGCPILADGGFVEVRPVMNLTM